MDFAALVIFQSENYIGEDTIAMNVTSIYQLRYNQNSFAYKSEDFIIGNFCCHVGS